VSRCGLPTSPPTGVTSWHTYRDADPGLAVAAVVVHGDQPALRRWVRVEGSKWSQHGSMVNYYAELTPLTGWPEIGECWAGEQHAVIAVRELPNGEWAADV